MRYSTLTVLSFCLSLLTAQANFPYGGDSVTDLLVNDMPWDLDKIRMHKDALINVNNLGNADVPEKDNAADESELGHVSDQIETQKFTATLDLNEIKGFVFFAIIADDSATLKVENSEGEKWGLKLKGTALWNGKAYKEFMDGKYLIPAGDQLTLTLEYENKANLTQKYKDDPDTQGLVDRDGVNVYVGLIPIDIIPDYNRDGIINDEDRDKVTKMNPFRWWVNDDNDSLSIAGDGSRDVPVNVNYQKDASDLIIDGMRDLVDFFPLYIEIEKALKIFPKDQYKYFLKHKQSAIKFHEIDGTQLEQDADNKGPTSYLRNLTKAKSLASARLKHATHSGVELSSTIIDAFEKNEGTIICEVIKKTDTPIILGVSHRSLKLSCD